VLGQERAAQFSILGGGGETAIKSSYPTITGTNGDVKLTDVQWKLLAGKFRDWIYLVLNVFIPFGIYLFQLGCIFLRKLSLFMKIIIPVGTGMTVEV